MAHASYRHRAQAENADTQSIVIDMAHGLNPEGGYMLVNELETRSLFSRVDVKGKKLLEVGCGTLPVTMAIPLRRIPRLFVASDVNWKIVTEARLQDGYPQYTVFSALEPAIKPGSLDFVVLNGVLHHLPPDCDLLGGLRRLLKPDGRILMLEPNVSCGPAEAIKWVLRRFFKMSMEASPYGQFNRKTILGLVEKARLTVEEEWFASLLAFPLTGGQGRLKVVPDSRFLFQILVAVDEALSWLLHRVPPLARFLHWRVLYRLSPDFKNAGPVTPLP